MSRKFLYIFLLILNYNIFIFSSSNFNHFLDKNDSIILKELFTVNIGIMKLKSVGNLQDIDPMDSQNVVNSIKNVLEKVPTIRLLKKESSSVISPGVKQLR